MSPKRNKNSNNNQQLEQEIGRLKDEIEYFHMERERVRNLVGKAGGVPNLKTKILNILFILLIGAEVVLAIHLSGHYSILMIEFAIALISIKLIHSVHKLMKVSHFEFWILSSLEWRINEMGKEIRQIANALKEKNKEE